MATLVTSIPVTATTKFPRTFPRTHNIENRILITEYQLQLQFQKQSPTAVDIKLHKNISKLFNAKWAQSRYKKDPYNSIPQV